MKNRYYLILPLLLLALILAACGGKTDLTAKRTAVKEEFNSLIDLTEENTSAMNEATVNGVMIDAEALDQYNASVDAMNALGDIIFDNADNAEEEELDTWMIDLGELKTKLAADYGVIQAYLDAAQEIDGDEL